jgi:hypothetical protein
MHLTGSRRNSVREATSDRASACMVGYSEVEVSSGDLNLDCPLPAHQQRSARHLRAAVRIPIQRLRCGERVNQSTLGNVADRNKLIRPMRHV